MDDLQSTMTDEASASHRPPGIPARRFWQIVVLVLGVICLGLIAYAVVLASAGTDPGTPQVAGIDFVWETYGPASGDRPLLDRPMGVAAGTGDRIYVTDAGNNRVCVFDTEGAFLFEFGTFGVAKPLAGAEATAPPGSLNFPVGIDTDDEGNVYVASFYNDSIEVFTAEGEPLRRFPDPQAPVGRGSSGAGGTGIAVTAVAVSGDRVYATDTYQIMVFSLDGRLLDQWGKPGTEAGDLDHPNGIAVGPDGTVYVSDTNHNRVTAFSAGGEVLWQVGAPVTDSADQLTPPIQLPRGIAVLADGSVLVCDAFADVLVRIGPGGTVIGRYGERGGAPGQLNLCNDLDALDGSVLVADKGNGRVQLLRLLTQTAR